MGEGLPTGKAKGDIWFCANAPHWDEEHWDYYLCGVAIVTSTGTLASGFCVFFSLSSSLYSSGIIAKGRQHWQAFSGRIVVLIPFSIGIHQATVAAATLYRIWEFGGLGGGNVRYHGHLRYLMERQ
jgi:hypothetical protein